MYIILNRFDATKKTKKLVFWKYVNKYNDNHKLSYIEIHGGLGYRLYVSRYCFKCDVYHHDSMQLNKFDDCYIKQYIKKMIEKIKNGGLC